MATPAPGTVDRVGVELVQLALATGIEEFRKEAFRRVDQLIGCDTCVSWGYPLAPANVTVIGTSRASWNTYLTDTQAFDADMTPLNAAAARAGAVQDVDVLSPRARDRSLFYQRIIVPIGIACFVTAPLFRRGRLIGVVNFGRHRRHYATAQVEAFKRLTSVLAVGEAIHAGVASGEEAATCDWLTPREREIVALVRTGLSNREIGGLCGMSHNTVRNHLASAFAKTGATNRIELLRFLGEGAQPGRW